jgi:hypothetical protein
MLRQGCFRLPMPVKGSATQGAWRSVASQTRIAPPALRRALSTSVGKNFGAITQHVVPQVRPSGGFLGLLFIKRSELHLLVFSRAQCYAGKRASLSLQACIGRIS